MIKIFVPNFVDSNDYSEAEQHGELIFMTTGVNVLTAQQLHKKFATYIAQAKDGDMLLLSGSNLLCATAYAEWVKRFPGTRDILVHDRKWGYRLHTIVE
jgi:hypothetical protein